ncbi:hypothetical protein E4U21_001184 [Claviceps maximensis]|nr:hypothetical protein E4U21_001184 [Claviceps maximensis]
MRLASLIAAAGTVCLAGAASAGPVTGQAPYICCCCDVRTMTVSCTPFIAKKDCVCAAVVCPDDAISVRDNDNHNRTASDLSKITRVTIPVDDEGRVLSVLPVDQSTWEETATMLAVKEARDQPFYTKSTLNPPSMYLNQVNEARGQSLYPIPTLKHPHTFLTKVKEARGQRLYPIPTVNSPSMYLNQVKAAEKISETALPTPYPASCCCCDIAISKIVCQARATDDCVCAMVMCPQNADTIYVTAPPATVT